MLKIFIILIISSFISFAQSQNYKEVKIYINSHQDIERLILLGLELDHFHYEKDKSIIAIISDKEFDILKNSNFNYEILINDWFEYYNNLPKLSESEKSEIIRQSKELYNVEGFGFGSMGGFYTLSEIYSRLDSMSNRYPHIITQKFQIGRSIENRPIYAIKISDNPNIAENEPQVQLNSLIHAREPAAMMALMYFMYYLLENYGTNPEVTYLVNNREIYFIPCINPDGYEHNRTTNPNGGGMWRKNRRNNGNGSFGVDLNRNWGYMWGFNNVGSSSNPSSETYRGTAPFSEPETQAVRNFTNQKQFNTALNYHTYSNLLLYPWGYINQPTSDNALFIEYSTDMVAYNGYRTGQPPAILYEANGVADDWMYGEQNEKPKIISMTPEVGSSADGFWPPQSRIFPLAIENLYPNLYITWAAGDFVSILNPNFSQQYFNPGDIVHLNIPQVRNKGLSPASNLTLTLSSDNPQITIVNGNINVGNIPARTNVSISQNFTFSIGNIPPDHTVRLFISYLSNNTIMRIDTLRFVIGVPFALFADTTNNINTNWNITATPSTPRWDVTTQTFYSAPNSYTDSPIGNYANNATVTMTNKNPINLSSYHNPKLSFYSRWDIENNYDYGQVRISTNNGLSWTPLAGNYTNLATGTFQPSGQPVYDGIQTNWVQEQISLSGFNSTQTRLLFELRTDPSVQRDGWYLDDITIYVMGIIPVELASFNAFIENSKVVLNWITSTERNNYGFEIQRKILGTNSNWENIGFVAGNGTTSEKSFYSFIDNEPINGSILYRLKQIDFDGSYKIFPSVSVDVNIPTKFSLEQNFPNPFNPTTEIQYSLKSKEFVQLKVFDILGNEIQTLVNEYQDAGYYKISFDASRLSSAIYFYSLIAGNFVDVKKMVLMK